MVKTGGEILSLFVIADLHLSLGTDKPMDIFFGWDDYVEKLKNNWQNLVSPEDTVVIPGDISWGMSLEDSLTDFKFLNELNGNKIIMKGNHDYWWNTKTKMEEFFKHNNLDTLSILNNNHFAYENIGICGSRGWFNETGDDADKKVLLREAGRLEMSIKSALSEGLDPVVFLHYPPIFGYGINEELMDVLYRYEIKHCFYGHIHGKGSVNAINGEKNGIIFRLISSDYLQFVPLNINDVVQYYKK